MAPDSDYISAGFASQIVGLSGLGQFNRIDLQKKLAGKVASAGASIGSTSEGLTGRASPKDLETMFQLIYLDFTAPRFDPQAYAAFKAQADSFQTFLRASARSPTLDLVLCAAAISNFWIGGSAWNDDEGDWGTMCVLDRYVAGRASGVTDLRRSPPPVAWRLPDVANAALIAAGMFV